MTRILAATVAWLTGVAEAVAGIEIAVEVMLEGVSEEGTAELDKGLLVTEQPGQFIEDAKIEV